MSCCQSQAPFVGVRVLTGCLIDAVNAEQNLLCQSQYPFACRGNTAQLSTAAFKNAHTQFFLELTNLSTDAGLGGIQNLCRSRDIQSVSGHLMYVTELLQVRLFTSLPNWYVIFPKRQ